MWYVLQTLTGQEEVLVQMIRKIVSPELYTDCFVAYYERIWRKQQKSKVHVERLFPGYVFIVADRADDLFMELKRIPKMSRLISAEKFEFMPIEAEEEAFFRKLLAEDKIIKASYVETDEEGNVCRVNGPLDRLWDRVVRIQFKKRYVLVRFEILGAEKQVALGIVLREDVLEMDTT